MGVSLSPPPTIPCSGPRPAATRRPSAALSRCTRRRHRAEKSALRTLGFLEKRSAGRAAEFRLAFGVDRSLNPGRLPRNKLCSLASCLAKASCTLTRTDPFVIFSPRLVSRRSDFPISPNFLRVMIEKVAASTVEKTPISSSGRTTSFSSSRVAWAKLGSCRVMFRSHAMAVGSRDSRRYNIRPHD
jgi:hypothetical protein